MSLELKNPITQVLSLIALMLVLEAGASHSEPVDTRTLFFATVSGRAFGNS